MEYDLLWEYEVVADDDQAIAQVEADITEFRSLLTKISSDEDLVLFF